MFSLKKVFKNALLNKISPLPIEIQLPYGLPTIYFTYMHKTKNTWLRKRSIEIKEAL